MSTRSMRTPVSGSRWVAKRAEHIFGRSNIVEYWPMTDTVGRVCRGFYGINGIYSAGVQLADLPDDDGFRLPHFNDADYLDLASSALSSAWSPSEGAILMRAKALNLAAWLGPAGVGYLFVLRGSTANNEISLYTSSIGLTCRCTLGGVAKNFVRSSMADVNWMTVGMSWSKSGDRAYAIWRATQLGNALTGLGTWAGSPTTAVIGAMNNVIHALGWKGWLGHVLLLRRPITPDEAKKWDATL